MTGEPKAPLESVVVNGLVLNPVVENGEVFAVGQRKCRSCQGKGVLPSGKRCLCDDGFLPVRVHLSDETPESILAEKESK